MNGAPLSTSVRTMRPTELAEVRDLGLTAPSTRIPDDAFMVYRLPGYRPWMRGRLVYPDPFWRVDAVGLRDQPPSQ